VRTIVGHVLDTDSITFKFNDGSVVTVRFPPATVVNAKACAIAQLVAQQFLNNLKPTGRWEGKIDWTGDTESHPLSYRPANRIPNWIRALVAAALAILMSLLVLRCVFSEWAEGLLGV
jgi:hypothetical protein